MFSNLDKIDNLKIERRNILLKTDTHFKMFLRF